MVLESFMHVPSLQNRLFVCTFSNYYCMVNGIPESNINSVMNILSLITQKFKQTDLIKEITKRSDRNANGKDP